MEARGVLTKTEKTTQKTGKKFYSVGVGGITVNIWPDTDLDWRTTELTGKNAIMQYDKQGDTKYFNATKFEEDKDAPPPPDPAETSAPTRSERILRDDRKTWMHGLEIVVGGKGISKADIDEKTELATQVFDRGTVTTAVKKALTSGDSDISLNTLYKIASKYGFNRESVDKALKAYQGPRYLALQNMVKDTKEGL